MASWRTNFTPLKVPCGALTSVFASMLPAALHGNVTVVANMAATAWKKNPVIRICFFM
jgi:hypothetical protein